MSIAVALGLVALIAAGARSALIRRVTDLEVLGAAPLFSLVDQLERPVASDQFRGKVVLADFVYTSCRDTCPLLSLRMQALQDRLRGERLLGGQVQILSFTVDPARDTPDVLRTYSERYSANPQAWRFLTGPEEAVLPVIVGGFYLGVEPGLFVSEDPDESVARDYEVMHSNRFVLIDRSWQIRAYYDGLAVEADAVIADIRQLLR